MSGPSPAAQALCRLLDMLCPMHVILDQSGRLCHAGPGFAKLFPGRELEGVRAGELLDLRRPAVAEGIGALLELAGKRLYLALRDPPGTELKGVLAPLGDLGAPDWAGGAVLNLSFGISIVEAVRDFELTNADFAATDMAVEMLFLVEAKSAAMEALRRLNERLDGARRLAEHEARTDKLTGLFNRRALEPTLDRLMGEGVEFALLHVDLDRFKEVNDTHGHAAGDAVLQCVARRLRELTREDDTVIRFGGDEFLLVLPKPGNRESVASLARRLIEALAAPIAFEGTWLEISASIGISRSRDYAAPEAKRMMKDADAALYAAKAAGRGTVRVHSASAGGPDG